MSWSRFGDTSSIYTYEDAQRRMNCCACLLLPDSFGTFSTGDADTFATHIDHHIAAGHRVPDGLADRIRADLLETA